MLTCLCLGVGVGGKDVWGGVGGGAKGQEQGRAPVRACLARLWLLLFTLLSLKPPNPEPHPDPHLQDSVIRSARVQPSSKGAGGSGGGGEGDGEGFEVSRAVKDRAVADLAATEAVDLTQEEGEGEADGQEAGAAHDGEWCMRVCATLAPVFCASVFGGRGRDASHTRAGLRCSKLAGCWARCGRTLRAEPCCARQRSGGQ